MKFFLFLLGSCLFLQAQITGLPAYFIKIHQARTLFAKNEPVMVTLLLGNQSEHLLKTKKFPKVLQHLELTRDGQKIPLATEFKDEDLLKKVGTLDMGEHREIRLNLKKYFPAVASGGYISLGYKDEIYDIKGKTIQVASVDLPDLNSDFVISTSLGEMVLRLDPELAPNHARNFAILVAMVFYKDMIWHRVEKDFVIQSGDPLGTGQGGSGFSLSLEKNAMLKHDKYALGMARSNDLDSATSQFYIALRETPELDASYTVFGKLVGGFEVADAIGSVPLEAVGNSGMNRPITPVSLREISIRPPQNP